MSERIIEITTDGRHLAVDRGFMTVSEQGKEIARIPLDDIGAIIGCAHGLTFSNNLLVQLARRNALFVVCAPNFNPIAFLWSVEGFHQQGSRMNAQIESTAPMSKQLWKQIVRAKIAQQAAILEALGKPEPPLKALIRKVRSGDPENVEAQAARRYWSLLFGPDFRRDRSAEGANALLNYGYTIVRSAVARAIMAAGLHPTLGIHHRNANNSMQLVDDMIEPFRPFVDFFVFHAIKSGFSDVIPDAKKMLAAVLEAEVASERGLTTLRTAIQNAAISLGLVYEKKRDMLDFPLPQTPLWQAPATTEK